LLAEQSVSTMLHRPLYKFQ